MIGDYEVWRMVRAAESEALARNHALRARLQLATQARPGLLRRLTTRLLTRRGAPPLLQPDAHHEPHVVHPVVRRTAG